jgi:hypothetical protein
VTLLAGREAQGRPGRQEAYRASFVRQVHHLLAAGYRQLFPPTLAAKEEPAITGLLVAAMRRWIDSPEAPRWVGRYAVHDDPPIDLGQAEGGRRPRVDVEIESTSRRPHPRFQFEAKRLRSDDPKCVTEYLGRDGLGCFTSSRYGAGHRDAGMLGYVQSGAPSEWAEAIHRRLSSAGGSYRLAPGCNGLEQQGFRPAFEHAYRSSHRRPTPLDVHHVLLVCC